MSDSEQRLLPTELTDLAKRVVDENRRIGRTVAVAESCTGGLVTAALTEIPGSSDVLECGFITYSNNSKLRVLDVGEDLVATFGAVSIAVAWGMAKGTLLKTEADVAVAITGVAGPGGGTEKKPVGTVVFACAERGKNLEDVEAELKNFDPELGRGGIRLQAALCALELLLP
jgi:nicotinamide-nucleotide amidase